MGDADYRKTTGILRVELLELTCLLAAGGTIRLEDVDHEGVRRPGPFGAGPEAFLRTPGDLAAGRVDEREGLQLDADDRIDAAIAPSGAATEVRGAKAWAPSAIAASKGAKSARPALVDGIPGLVVAPRGKLLLAVRFTFAGDKIASLEVVADADRLAKLEVSLLD